MIVFWPYMPNYFLKSSAQLLTVLSHTECMNLLLKLQLYFSLEVEWEEIEETNKYFFYSETVATGWVDEISC